MHGPGHPRGFCRAMLIEEMKTASKTAGLVFSLKNGMNDGDCSALIARRSAFRAAHVMEEVQAAEEVCSRAS